MYRSDSTNWHLAVQYVGIEMVHNIAGEER
jgi:hypothetical protein